MNPAETAEPTRTTTDDATGFFGKIPALGDFVNRRLPRQFLEPWDQWLQQVLTQSRAQLGEDWLDLYLVSPLWRFVLSPGIAGRSAWAGVIMPSVDGVGRYFPLTLARAVAPQADCFRLLCTHDWFERLEALALSTLEDDFDMHQFEAALLSLPPPPLRLQASPNPAGSRVDAWQLEATEASLDHAANRLLRQAMEDVFLSYSLWWSAGSEHVNASLLTCQGLPPPEACAAMLGGDWNQGGWLRLGSA